MQMTDFCWMTDIKQLMDIVSPSSAPLPPLSWGEGRLKREVTLQLSIYPPCQAKQPSLFSFSRLYVLKTTTSHRCGQVRAAAHPTAPPVRGREVSRTSSSGQTTYDVIGRVGLAQIDSSFYRAADKSCAATSGHWSLTHHLLGPSQPASLLNSYLLLKQ